MANFSMGEQQESYIQDLTSLDTGLALLKTKGAAPTMFVTYNLVDNGLYEINKSYLRKLNLENGYLLDVNEIAESLTFQPSAIYELDEPESFFE